MTSDKPILQRCAPVAEQARLQTRPLHLHLHSAFATALPKRGDGRQWTNAPANTHPAPAWPALPGAPLGSPLPPDAPPLLHALPVATTSPAKRADASPLP